MKVFSAMVDNGREGQDGIPSVRPVYRNLLAKDGYPPPNPDMATSWGLFRSILETGCYCHVRRSARVVTLSWRRIVDGEVGPYIWKTYKEVYDEILHIGSGLREPGLDVS